jgi:pantothenate kinase
MIDAVDVERYLRFDRGNWAELRAQTPLTLHEKDLEALRGINDRIYM